MATTVFGLELLLQVPIRCVRTRAVVNATAARQTEYLAANPQDHEEADDPNDLLPA